MNKTPKKYRAALIVGKSTAKALDTKTGTRDSQDADRTFAEILPLLAQGGADVIISDAAVTDILASSTHSNTPLAEILRKAQREEIPGIIIEKTAHPSDSRAAFEQLIEKYSAISGEKVIALTNEAEALEAMAGKYPAVGFANSSALLMEANNHGLLELVDGLVNDYGRRAITDKTLPAAEVQPIDTYGRNYDPAGTQDVVHGQEGPLGRALEAIAQELAPKEEGHARRVVDRRGSSAERGA